MTLRPDTLPYRKPELGKDYWIKDNILPDPCEVADRCFNRTAWILGSPWRPEPWPGMRSPQALEPDELAVVERWVLAQTGAKALRTQGDPAGGQSSHNFCQLVGGADGVSRPHVDSSRLCDFAAVLFLHPFPPTRHAGTSFYRLKLPDGTLGGNICPPPYESLSQIPGLEQGTDLTMWEEDIEVHNVFNRLLLYKSDIVHSATSYFGWHHEPGSMRLTVTFFWKVPE
ncbi:MAG: hypothetical protein HY284_01105 [Nitrospirae bacterium]|nr:hypothetical protein [Nitrospirota bacterium]